MSWEAWFKRFGDYIIEVGFYESKREIDIEEMYQMFKSRMQAEKPESNL